MVHVGHEIVDKLVKVFTRAMSTSLLIVLFFVLQYVFDMEFQCSCRPGLTLNDVLYLTVPPIILTWVLVYIDSWNQRRLCGGTVPSALLWILLKFMSVAAVWFTAVLFNGDWYVCRKTNSDSIQVGLPCKEQDKLVDEEKEVQKNLKIESLVYGMILICSVFLAWTLFQVVWMCHNRRTRHQQQKKCTELCCPPFYKVVYENILAEQVSAHLEEELTRLAAARARVVCRPFLEAIEEDEKKINITDERRGAEEAWHEISAAHFYMQHQRLEEEPVWEEPVRKESGLPMVQVNTRLESEHSEEEPL